MRAHFNDTWLNAADQACMNGRWEDSKKHQRRAKQEATLAADDAQLAARHGAMIARRRTRDGVEDLLDEAEHSGAWKKASTLSSSLGKAPSRSSRLTAQDVLAPIAGGAAVGIGVGVLCALTDRACERYHQHEHQCAELSKRHSAASQGRVGEEPAIKFASGRKGSMAKLGVVAADAALIAGGIAGGMALKGRAEERRRRSSRF
ncbi:hypothetical protein JCM8547_001790 [Rhodosporidiobolus lusitaniae]